MKRVFEHPPELGGGKRYWRSVNELSDTPEFRQWLEREFPNGAANDYGVDVFDIRGRHNCAYRVVRRVEIDVVGSNHDDVGFFPGRQCAALVRQSGAGGAIHGRAFQHFAHIHQLGRVGIAVDSSIGGPSALDVKHNAHFRKHVGSIGDFVVHAEARANAVIQRFLKCRYPLSKPVLRIGSGTNIHGAAGFADSLPRRIGQGIAVVVGNVRTQ